MTKGDRVRNVYTDWMGTIVSEIDPFDPRVLIKWDDSQTSWADAIDVKVIPPLRLLAEQAE